MPDALPSPAPAFWSGSAAAFLATPPTHIEAALAAHQLERFRTTDGQQLPAWRDAIVALRAALLACEHGRIHVLLELPLLRLARRIDAVLLTPNLIVVLEFKREQADAAARRQTEDYALDLFDFHSASRHHPIVPILVTGGAPPTVPPMPLFHGVTPVLVARPEQLPILLAGLLDRAPRHPTPLTASTWLAGTYAPIPTIIDAACMAYARNGVADLAAARADRRNLRETTEAIWSAIAESRATGRHSVLFVTGIPGAGKTLCGLNAAFAPDESLRGTFLTGNPTLVHVLREALIRDAGGARRAHTRRMHTVIQRLPDFRTHYLTHAAEAPPEPVVVIDEAQRCWSRAHAIRKTRDKPLPLTDSEPGHLLDIMRRRTGFAVLVCMIGGGQEIHDGEGGLAEWGAALRTRPEWHIIAAPGTRAAPDPRQQLGPLPRLRQDPALHLDVPIRQIRGDTASRWADAMLAGDLHAAAAIAAGSTIPFTLTRSLATLRAALRAAARGTRRAGLLASSGAARLRAEGLGAELPHMEPAAVAHWFLNHFPPDIRASDALEQCATEFGIQGLELDYAGLCWDLDLIPAPSSAWTARRFAGTAWQTLRNPEAISNQINTYRVLLTRARYHTVIFVPRGDPNDATRHPALYDALADRLTTCGVPAAQPPAPATIAEPPPPPRLL